MLAIALTDYRTIQEFPEWEINVEGIIRNKISRERRYAYSGDYGEIVKFTKNGVRYARSVEKLKRIAFSAA